MLKRLFLVTFFLTACSDEANDSKVVDSKVADSKVTDVAKPQQLTVLEQYQHKAKNLLLSIRTRKAAADIVIEAEMLVANSRRLLSSFTLKYPQCREYLTALDKEAEAIASQPIPDIESGYHDGDKLPNFDDPVCYYAKNLLVHPAKVQAIALLGMNSELAYQDAEMEMVEAIAHFEQVEQALDKK
ncbi:MAG: hypothetical protein ACTJH9_02455 [Pseudoalteromonas sp.]|uniref:hypothetical protein n=1 Tax=unclassified Pseudoalteromonas TaxID=194690 RepID=UPI003F99AC4F